MTSMSHSPSFFLSKIKSSDLMWQTEKRFVRCCTTDSRCISSSFIQTIMNFPPSLIEQKASCLGMNWYCYCCYLETLLLLTSIFILTSVTNNIANLHPRGGLIARSTLGEVQADTRSLCLKEPAHHDDHIDPCLDDFFCIDKSNDDQNPYSDGDHNDNCSSRLTSTHWPQELQGD